MQQVVAYLRVSTDRQGKSGLGIEAQREAVARFATAEVLEVLAEFVEVETGKGCDALDRRPKLRDAWPLPARQWRRWWWPSWTGFPATCRLSPA